MRGRRTNLLAIAAATLLAALTGCTASAKPVAGHRQPPASTTSTNPATSTPSTPPLPLGQIGTRAQIPWSSVGVGWSLALAGPSTATHLLLIAPTGGVYDVASFPSARTTTYRIVDHSGDGRRALIEATDTAGTSDGTGRIDVEIDLRTGMILMLRLPPATTVTGYTKPSGAALLAIVHGGSDAPSSVERLDLNDHPQQVYDDHAMSGALMTPDGAAVVVAHAIDRLHTQLRLVGNRGHVIRALPTPPHAETCTPQRWWTSRTVLASCSAGSENRLWLIPVDGSGADTPLTHQRDDKGPDYGDLDAWRLPSGAVYLSAAGACGGVIIAKEDAHGRAQQVFVPHQPERNEILGVDGAGRMLVDSSSEGDGCAQRDTYVWFDPAANRTAPFATRLPVGGRIYAVQMWASADDVT
jgi:TolB protein